MQYTELQPALDDEAVAVLTNTFRFSKEFARLLYKRGIDTPAKCEKFLHPKLSDLYDPFLLSGMKEAVERIRKALANREKIVIFGDYDVDGISASFILADYLKEQGAEVSYFLPCRVEQGYGLTLPAIEQVLQQYNPKLIVTVDCGISCKDEVEFIKSKGVDIVITDHHDIPDQLPECITVNPKLKNQAYPYDKLCGAGVALKLVHALSHGREIVKYLITAAIATIADIVPLTDENRIIVKLGLAHKKFLPAGLKELANSMKIRKLSAKEISFRIAPKINAPGRMGDSMLAIKLYFEKDLQKIKQIIEEMNELNKRRQDVGAEIFQSSEQILEGQNLSKTACIVLEDAGWEPGLLGIACAKLVSDYNRPVFLFSESGEGILKGSSRSIDGINIMECLDSVKDLTLNYGGHEMAAGLSILRTHFDAFKQRVNAYCAQKQFEGSFVLQKEYDAVIDISKLNIAFAEELQLLNPTGFDNPTPVFKIAFDEALVNPNKNYPQHIYVRVGGHNFIFFNGIAYYDLLKLKTKKEALLEIELDDLMARPQIKGIIKHVKQAHESIDDDILDGLFLYNFMASRDDSGFKGNIQSVTRIEAAQKLENPGMFKTLFVASSRSDIKQIENSKLTKEVLKLVDLSGQSGILLAPLVLDGLQNYEEVVFLTRPYKLDVSALTETKVYVSEDKANLKYILQRVESSRDSLGYVYKAIKLIAVGEREFKSIFDFYEKLCGQAGQLSFSQMMFCLKVFTELGFISVINEYCRFTVSVNKNIKKNLDESSFYQLVVRLKNEHP